MKKLSALIAVIVFGLPASSAANPITYDFSILVGRLSPGAEVAFPGVQVGDLLDGSLTYDPSTAIRGEAYRIGGGETHFAIDRLPIFDTDVFWIDSIYDYSLTVVRPDQTFFAWHWGLGPLQGGHDPLIFPESASAWITALGPVPSSGPQARMEATLESLHQVPEPASLLLVAVGGVVLLMRDRLTLQGSRSLYPKKVSSVRDHVRNQLNN